ncbi:helix-turn-helix domain-containing protein [Melaminivora sp.]
MATIELKNLIDAAAEKAGNQKQLADMLGVHKSNITQMKNGERPCNLRTRAKLAEVAGYDVQTAVLEGVIEEFQGGSATEIAAAEGLKAILKAFPVGKLERAMGIEPTS